MLTIKQIKDNKEYTLERLAVKGVDARETVDKIIALDELRRQTQQQLDSS
ncbi:MAG: serine--tRNA ligase, partial [Tidjanibacter sp.]|nr:serine--tRNA ligase [Tidjanibacter sp.]